jgi:hypothetical protein
VSFDSSLAFVRTATDNRGRKIFLDLPFSLRIRLSHDPVNGRLCFRGYEDRTGIGEPLLLPNIFSVQEREMIVNLVDASNPTIKTVWADIVGKLYRTCLNPNGLDLNGDGVADEAMLSGLRRVNGKIVPEEFGDGPKALTAADPTVAPALPDPGKAVAFSATGSSQHLKIENPRGSPGADGKVPRLQGSFSIEFWMRPQSGTTDTNILVRLGANPLKALRIGYRSGYMTFEFNTQRLRSDEPVATADRDAWQHYAFVYDADAQRATIFRNGLVAGTAVLRRRPGGVPPAVRRPPGRDPSLGRRGARVLEDPCQRQQEGPHRPDRPRRLLAVRHRHRGVGSRRERAGPGGRLRGVTGLRGAERQPGALRHPAALRHPG